MQLLQFFFICIENTSMWGNLWTYLRIIMWTETGRRVPALDPFAMDSFNYIEIKGNLSAPVITLTILTVLISLKIFEYFETSNFFETIWLFRRESCLGGEGFVSSSDIKRHHCWHHRPHHHHHHHQYYAHHSKHHHHLHAEHDHHQWWFNIIANNIFIYTIITITIAHNTINISNFITIGIIA